MFKRIRPHPMFWVLILNSICWVLLYHGAMALFATFAN